MPVAVVDGLLGDPNVFNIVILAAFSVVVTEDDDVATVLAVDPIDNDVKLDPEVCCDVIIICCFLLSVPYCACALFLVS